MQTRGYVCWVRWFCMVFVATVGLGGASGWLGVEAHAQSTKPTSRPAVSAKTKPTVEPSPDQVTVYVPYRKLGSLLRQQGVFLTKKQFKLLLQQARKYRDLQRKKLPVDYLITRSMYKGTVRGRVVSLKVVLEVRVLRAKSWVALRLPFSGLPLVSATLNDKSAMVLSPNGRANGYLVLAKGSGVHRLALEFSGRVDRVGAGYSLKMGIPSTPQTELKLQWLGGDWQVRLFDRRMKSLGGKKGVSKISASLGPRNQLRVRWQPLQRAISTQKRLVSAKIFLESTLSQGMIQTQGIIRVRVVRGKLHQLKLKLPLSHKLISVEGGTLLRNWSVVKEKTHRKLLLKLRRAVEGKFVVRLNLEQLLKGKKTLVIPSISVMDAKWQHGWVALRTDGPIQLKVEQQKGLSQIDPEEFAKQVKSAPPSLAFAYLQPTFDLQISLQKIKPRLRVQVTHLIGLEPKQAQVKTKIVYRIERAGVFRLRFGMPKGWKLREVRCPSMRDHYMEKGTLIVVLKQKLGGPIVVRRISPHRVWRYLRGELGWQLFRKLKKHHRAMRRKLLRKKAVERLQKLMGYNAQRSSKKIVCHIELRRSLDKATTLAMPLLQPLDVENERGLVGLFVADFLELETKQLKGLLSKDDLTEFRYTRVGKHRIRQAYRYVGRPIAGTLQWRRKKTAMEGQLWLPVKIQDDGYRVDGIVQYKARFAGIQKLKLQVPASIAPHLRFVTDTREVRKKKGKKHWIFTFVLHRKVPRDGTFHLHFSFHRNLKKPLEVGRQVKLDLLAFQIPGALRQITYWGFQKEESISLNVLAASGYERVDTSDLPSFARGTDMSRMMRTRSRTPGTLQVSLRKHKYAKVLTATIPRLHVEMASSLDGEVHVLAVAQIQNRGRQFLAMRLPKGAKVLALRVAGRNRYRFELNRKGELLVDLHYRSKGRPFWVVVRYKHSLPKASKLKGWWGAMKLSGPKIKDTPVLHSTLQLYLPPRYNYSAFHTSMMHRLNRKDLWAALRKMMWGRRHYSLHRIHDIYQMRRQAGDLSSQFPRRGSSFQLVSNDANVKVKVEFRRSYFQNFLELLFALGAFFLLFWIRGSNTAFGRSVQILVGSLIVMAFLGSIFPYGWVHFSYAGMFGAMGAGGFWVAGASLRWSRRIWDEWKSMKSSKEQWETTPVVEPTTAVEEKEGA